MHFPGSLNVSTFLSFAPALNPHSGASFPSLINSFALRGSPVSVQRSLRNLYDVGDYDFFRFLSIPFASILLSRQDQQDLRRFWQTDRTTKADRGAREWGCEGESSSSAESGWRQLE
jgi:hypothetical protein